MLLLNQVAKLAPINRLYQERKHLSLTFTFGNKTKYSRYIVS